ncbi:DUF3618 domain-containing protein [Nocardioides ferulae]|uniref:DUF3618 domain-containing protein n=1 Tax=Nocardioides ferulae TaxID=2340821 RepID=UPI000EAF6E52|nr:DUF3618 domain-containing protein [Nocardioides ferulae]
MSATRSPEQIEAEIAAQREQLAATVSELQEKLDVKAQARQRVGGLRERLVTPDGSPRPEAVAAGAVLLGLTVLLVVRRARR